jgi:class 3 adenylate cyclase
VLPLESDVFEEVSVSCDVSSWSQLYHDIIGAAESVRVANSHSSAADGTAFEYGTRYLLGIAHLHARMLDTPLIGLAAWDGAPGDGHGGTQWAVAHMSATGIPVENVYPGKEGIIEPLPLATENHDGRPMRAILFADCKGYSKLREEEIARYTQQFLSGVRRLIERMPDCPPVEYNTWGDGLFLAFTNVRSAARFAMALRAAALGAGETLDLPAGVRLRIGLHAGPVTSFIDPITGRPNLAGTNVAFAARIEPIVPENQICVSEPFAAMAFGDDQFRFEYLGLTEFAKGFGRHPLYRLTRGSQD